ncbi:MAG: SPOR domain-containing protein, partial [Spirochaetes bacterium]|nr:SPOR domain-containing protein [Spirochaetota bacterium]
EYYQVNLDTGRIFWIVFVLGIIVIGIFFLGIYLGRDKEDTKLFSFDRSKFLRRGDVSSDTSAVETVEASGEDTPILRLLEEDLSDESRYIEIEEIQVPTRPGTQQKAEAETVLKKTAVRPETVRADTLRVEQKPAVKKTAPSKPYVQKGDYYIQIASFAKRENADTMAEDLRGRLYKVVVMEASVDEKTFYRVRVGPFETEGVAKNTMISMKRQFNLKDPFVVKKSS